MADADNTSKLAKILAAQPDEEELRRQQRNEKYGEPWTPRGIALLPNRIADIGNHAAVQLTDPRLLPTFQPLPWLNTLSGLLRGVGRNAFGVQAPDDDLQLPTRNKLVGDE